MRREQGFGPLSAPALAAGVTPREVEVLEQLALGSSTPEIAAALFLSPLTVKQHLVRLSEKLGAHNRTHLLVIALRQGIVTLD